MTYTDLVINGVFQGMGTGIGSYLATKYAINHLQNAEQFIKKKQEEVRHDPSKTH